MKSKNVNVQELCQKLKIQLEELSTAPVVEESLPREEQNRRHKLMEQLKQQLAELS